jgi:hypothetical protein
LFQSTEGVFTTFLCGKWSVGKVHGLCRLILGKQAGESDDGFQRRLKTHGASQFQAALWQVHDAMSKTAVWSELSEAQQKLAMQVCVAFSLS